MAEKTSKFRFTRVSLPYLNNWQTVLITLLLNAALSFIGNFQMHAYDIYAIGLDAIICAFVTTTINVLIVYHGMQKAWQAGIVPPQVPVSRFMMMLPKSRLALIAVIGLSSALLCGLINCGVFYYFGFQLWTFAQFMLYKLAYSLLLSERIVSLVILRMVQPDYQDQAPEQSELPSC